MWPGPSPQTTSRRFPRRVALELDPIEGALPLEGPVKAAQFDADKLRVVVQLPDSAVPFLDKGDPAMVRIDSLPGKKFPARVSRKTGKEI